MGDQQADRFDSTDGDIAVAGITSAVDQTMLWPKQKPGSADST